jgi:sugar phosphate isomerase/epimerase
MITLSAFADEIDPSLKTQMDVCQSQGIACIDVRGIDGKNVSKMSVREVREYRRQMADRGFRVPCVGSPLGKIRIDEDFGQHLDLLKHCCELAREFGTELIRVFSFYPTPGADIMAQRGEVMERLEAMAGVAAAEGIVLLHENEKNIYGAKPTGVLDIFKTIKSPNFKGIYDPANYVEEGIAPFDDGWNKGLDAVTDYFHIKDVKRGGGHTCVPAGEGDGQIPQLLEQLKERNWSGYMTLEPHMQKGGQFAGFTGPDLFAKAVGALKGLLEKAGLEF